MAPPCTGQLSLLAVGGWSPSCQMPSLAWDWAETCWSCLPPKSVVWAQGAPGRVWVKVGAAYLAGAVRGGGTQVQASIMSLCPSQSSS